MNNQQKVMMPYHDIHSPFTVGENGAFADYIAQDPAPKFFPDMAVGALVLIQDRQRGVWLTGRIVELRAVSPFNPKKEAMLYHEDESVDPTAPLEEVTGPHTHQPMIARIHLAREMKAIVALSHETSPESSSVSYASCAVLRPPSAFSRLLFPDIQNDAMPDLHDILEIKKSGLTLGFVGQGSEPIGKKSETGSDFLPYRWDVEHLDNKHISIVGESGSGKTVLLKNLAYELRRYYSGTKEHARVIMTDVQGDVSQLLFGGLDDFAKKFSIIPSGWRNEVRGRETPQNAVKHFEKMQLVLPAQAEKYGVQSPKIQALTELAEKAGCKVTKIGLRLQDLSAPSDAEYLFRVTSGQVAMLLNEAAENLKNNSKHASIEELKKLIVSKLKGANSGSSGQIVLASGTPYYPSTFYAAQRALKALEDHFDHHYQSMQSEDNPLDCFKHKGTTILYLDELGHEERVMWEMQLVKWLYDNKSEMGNTFAFFDEAHQIIPADSTAVGGAKETFDRLRMNFVRLAREGRKFRVNLVLSTQSPRDLHPIVPEMCPTKIVMKISPRNAQAAEVAKELAPIAARFGHGEFWIQSPFNGTPDWVRVHSPAPPVLHAPMTEWWKAVDES